MSQKGFVIPNFSSGFMVTCLNIGISTITFSRSSSFKKKNPKILVLGAKGMAGHISTEFLKENTNWEVIPLDRSVFEVEESKGWKDKIIKFIV